MKSAFNVFGFLILLLLIGVGCLGTNAEASSRADFYENVTRLSTVLSEIDRKYVEEVDSKEVTDAAIDGIRKVLDPHTAVFSPKDYSDLKVSTEGEFGGLGITIAIRDEWLTIISPLQGTPAFRLGLQAGDRIVKIAGKSTEGISIEDAVDKLRGKVGTDVTITIYREGNPETLDYTVTRGLIQIHSVPWSGMIQGDVGYIKVAQFAKRTSSDIEKAIEELRRKGMKKLVLDLRYNPGGLLSQAIAVSELFLEEGSLVVSTKGRIQATESNSSREPLLDKDFPLAVLINGGSASAAEIVAGAIQDWDRGVVLGSTSFGKGSVQTIYRLGGSGHALKLTTAFYYLPMGRCINKPENGIRDKKHVSDSDSSAIDTTRKVFRTKNGREMFGEGGITPDLELEPGLLAWYGQMLERKNAFFRFAVKQRPLLEAAGAKLDANWKVPDSLLTAFRSFLAADSGISEARDNAQSAMGMVREILLKEQSLQGDSSEILSDSELKLAMESLQEVLKKRRNHGFEREEKTIRRGLKREFLGIFLGDGEKTEFSVGEDPQVQAAVKILSDSKKYDEMLAPPKKK